jgi:Na+/H+ antiporter NhaC
MEKKKEGSNLVLPITIIILIVIVVLYLISLGKLNFLDSEVKNKKRNLEERKRIIDSQFAKIESLLSRKKSLKDKLDKINLRVLIVARTLVVFIIIGASILGNQVMKLSLLDIGSYLGLIFILLAFISFIRFGNPENVIEFWRYIEKKLTIKIYGKYINLENHFDRHEKQKESLLMENIELQKQLEEVEEIEREILFALLEEDQI